MAGRKQSNSADYFAHDADASSDEKLVYLESVFGHTGYALYFKFLEKMTRADGFKLEWNEIKRAVYASEFSISVTEIDRFVAECCRKEIKAFVIEDEMLFSPGLIKRFQPLIEKREYNRQKYQERKKKENNELSNSATEKPNSADEKTQSKVKQSKVIPPYSPPKGKIDQLKDYLEKSIPEEQKPFILKILEFYKYRQQKPKKHKYKSEKGVNGLFRDLSNCHAAGYDLNTCLDIAMERDWLTPAVDYFKPDMFKAVPQDKTKEQILKEHGLSVA